MSGQRIGEEAVGHEMRLVRVDHDDIQTYERFRVSTKGLSCRAFDAVSIGRQSAPLFADGEPQACWVSTIVAVQDGEVTIPTAFRPPKNASEGVGIQKSLAAPEALIVCCTGPVTIRCGSACAHRRVALRCHVSLWRQARTPFCTALFDDAATGFRGHSRAESMRACPLDFAGLERAFHLPATCLFKLGFAPGRPPGDSKAGKGTRGLKYCQ